MAYMNSLLDGAKLAFMVGLVLAITNGVTARISGKTLDAMISERLPTMGGGQ
tara:strand:+ start:1711 stop:1866 length:156 start_codon:yes stop_codon:yes gene_type:complete